MPSFNIVKSHDLTDTFRVSSIKGQFDLSTTTITETFAGTIPVEDRLWKIGAIVGNSGTGKTTISQHLFPDAYFHTPRYTHDSVVDDLPKEATTQEITTAFTRVGFASVPSWLKSYAVLSQGEQMRVNLAYALLLHTPLIVFDEFTSVVDRNIAKIGAHALQKAIRATPDRQFIAVSCHHDILDWLLPDWVFSTDTMTCVWPRKKKTRPQFGDLSHHRRYVGHV